MPSNCAIPMLRAGIQTDRTKVMECFFWTDNCPIPLEKNSCFPAGSAHRGFDVIRPGCENLPRRSPP
ncbi:hypothetical protein NG791_05560 [Laspinema sp. D1]|uniref:hypothetical protein n=1 Tax=Laspinema palackyanum TaxID=3231601 RepID=UPI00347AFC15|nr:hypothetical protein [Laspinema sp. D2b]